jgi:hypothetical protein
VVGFWIWLWGPLGGVIALPLLIMFKVICDHTPPLRVVGALIGAPLVRVNGRSEEDTIEARGGGVGSQAVAPRRGRLGWGDPSMHASLRRPGMAISAMQIRLEYPRNPVTPLALGAWGRGRGYWTAPCSTRPAETGKGLSRGVDIAGAGVRLPEEIEQVSTCCPKIPPSCGSWGGAASRSTPIACASTQASAMEGGRQSAEQGTVCW